MKLLDYASRQQELDESSNPFAIVALSYLKTRATRRDPEDRFHWKLRLFKMLYEKGFARKDITVNKDLKKIFVDYQGLYFLGSRSRGDYREDSDYDMVFVFYSKPDWRKKDKIREIVYRKELEYDIVIDSKYYAQEEIENYRTPFRETVYK